MRSLFIASGAGRGLVLLGEDVALMDTHASLCTLSWIGWLGSGAAGVAAQRRYASWISPGPLVPNVPER